MFDFSTNNKRNHRLILYFGTRIFNRAAEIEKNVLSNLHYTKIIWGISLEHKTNHEFQPGRTTTGTLNENITFE